MESNKEKQACYFGKYFFPQINIENSHNDNNSSIEKCNYKFLRGGFISCQLGGYDLNR